MLVVVVVRVMANAHNFDFKTPVLKEAGFLGLVKPKTYCFHRGSRHSQTPSPLFLFVGGGFFLILPPPFFEKGACYKKVNIN